MSVLLICDGCGKDNDPEHVAGLTEKRHYCNDCIDSVQAFIEARDGIHDEIRAAFKKKVEKLSKDWLKDHPKGKLPDVQA